jgi:hypothetical protein
MNGSNLEMTSSSATNDLREMLYAGSGDEVNVVVQTGGSKYWHNYYVDENRNQRWYVKKFGMDEVYNGELENMAQADTLSDFLIWGINNYKADHYAVILWNHGGGAIAGFGLDENAPGDTLILEEMKNAFEKTKKITGKTFDLVAFDACLMSNIETAYVLSPYCRYMAASEGLMSDMGYAYDVFINDVKNNTDKGGDYLGESLIDSYIYEADMKGSVASSLAVLDLKNVEDVKSKFDDAISDIDVESDFSEFAKAAYGSAAAGRLVSISEQANMVDIQDFVKSISDTDLKSELDKLVIYKASTDNNSENLSGVSIYFPYSNIQYAKNEYIIYKTIGFSDTYTQMLKNYISVLSGNTESTYEESADTKYLPTNTKSLLNANMMYGYADGDEIIVSCVYPYRANNTKNDTYKIYSYFIGSKPITVYKKYPDDNLLYTPAMINGQYCEIVIDYDSKGMYIKEAIALLKNNNNSVVPLKTFLPEDGDVMKFVTLVVKNGEISADMTDEIVFGKDVKITKEESGKDKIKLMLSGIEAKPAR